MTPRSLAAVTGVGLKPGWVVQGAQDGCKNFGGRSVLLRWGGGAGDPSHHEDTNTNNYSQYRFRCFHTESFLLKVKFNRNFYF